MFKYLILLLSLSFTCSSNNDNTYVENLKMEGLYHASSPSAAEGNYYFFEDEQFHVFWRYDKDTRVNEYAARFDYYIEKNKIFACNKVLLCNSEDQYELRYEVISNEMIGGNQYIKLKAPHFDSPLILERIK